MRQKSGSPNRSSEQICEGHPPRTRKHYSAEEQICIVLDGLRGESSIAELCRREGIAEPYDVRQSLGRFMKFHPLYKGRYAFGLEGLMSAGILVL
jgi:hypothetical protein